MAKKKATGKKKKIIVEALTDLLVVGPDHTRGWIKVYNEYPAEVTITDSKNSGGEAWDWAQAHWDEFAPAQQPVTLAGLNEHEVIAEGTLRWVCVCGILDAKTRKALPITELNYRHASNRRYANRKRGEKTEPIKEVGRPDSSSSKKRKSTKTSAKTVNKPAQSSKKGAPTKLAELVGGADVGRMVQDKVERVLAEEDDE